MKVKRTCSWLLASAITVVFAATLMTLALPSPAEAGHSAACVIVGPGISNELPDPCVEKWDYCNFARAACRDNPVETSVYKKDHAGNWDLICGSGSCPLPTY